MKAHVLWWLILWVNLTGYKVPRLDVISGLSVRLFLEEISIWISGFAAQIVPLGVGGHHPTCWTKDRGRSNLNPFSASLSDQHWRLIPSPPAFRLQLHFPVLWPLDLGSIVPPAFLGLQPAYSWWWNASASIIARANASFYIYNV